MSAFLPLRAWGPVTFTSGYSPKSIQGPKRTNYVQEHEIPGSEGGVVEYLGSKQPTYKLQGFLAPLNDQFNGPAIAVLSGTTYLALSADDALHYLQGLRGSGAQLLRIESSWSNFSGYTVLYENDFFYCVDMTFGLEAGRGYPYYPYTIDLMRASYSVFGNNSGNQTVSPNPDGNASGAYFSGYMRAWLVSGAPRGGVVMGLGAYLLAARSGSLQMGIYSTGNQLLAQTASQGVTSGWNYLPLNPTIKTTSGINYIIGLMSDQVNNTSDAFGYSDTFSSGISFIMSGTPYLSGFPATLIQSYVSGWSYDTVIVTN